MGVVALAVPSQLGAASLSAGDSQRYNGGAVLLLGKLPKQSIVKNKASARARFVAEPREVLHGVDARMVTTT
jgi:hypothetical protein